MSNPAFSGERKWPDLADTPHINGKECPNPLYHGCMSEIEECWDGIMAWPEETVANESCKVARAT
jgi:hypothetical protein